MQPVCTHTTDYTHCGASNEMYSIKTSHSHLRVFKKSVFLNAFNEHQSVGAVSGPVQQVLHQVLMVLKDSLWKTVEMY